MFFYKYYDYLIVSNVELFNFESATDLTNKNTVQVNYIMYEPQKYIINASNKYIFYDDVIFEMIMAKKTINIISTDSMCFQEVIRNKPFGYYCYLDKRVVLHASAVECHNQIYAFCGPKGAGKTTMAIYLSKKYKLFTDDQLCITLKNNRLFAISPDNIQKVTTHTANLLSVKNECGQFNTQYKKYMHHSNNYTNCKYGHLNTIFILRRNNGSNTYVEKICDHAHKISHIISNLVASSCYNNDVFDSDIIKSISNVDMYYLFYCNFE